MASEEGRRGMMSSSRPALGITGGRRGCGRRLHLREGEGVPYGIDADTSAKLARQRLKMSVDRDETRGDENRWGSVRVGSAGVPLLQSYPLLFTFTVPTTSSCGFSQRHEHRGLQ